MNARVSWKSDGWYWRSDTVNSCGPFSTCAEAMADALGLAVKG